MKKIFIIFILIFFTELCFSQPPSMHSFRNEIKLGVGYVFLGSYDLSGITLNGEYSYSFIRHMSLAGAIGLIYGNRENSVLNANTAAINTDLSLYISPFGINRKFDFRTGFGISGRYVRASSSYIATGFDPILRKSFEYIKKNSYEGFTYGFSIIFCIDLAISKVLFSGLKTAYQDYRNGDTQMTISLQMGYKF